MYNGNHKRQNYAMDRPLIQSGYVRIENGIIADVGKDAIEFAGEEVFDAEGKILLPGFVDAHSHIGMWEDGWALRAMTATKTPTRLLLI